MQEVALKFSGSKVKVAYTKALESKSLIFIGQSLEHMISRSDQR
jgi:hypothetical protein